MDNWFIEKALKSHIFTVLPQLTRHLGKQYSWSTISWNCIQVLTADLTAGAWVQDELPSPREPQEGRQGSCAPHGHPSSCDCPSSREVSSWWEVAQSPSHNSLSHPRCFSWWTHFLESPFRGPYTAISLITPEPCGHSYLPWGAGCTATLQKTGLVLLSMKENSCVPVTVCTATISFLSSK